MEQKYHNGIRGNPGAKMSPTKKGGPSEAKALTSGAHNEAAQKVRKVSSAEEEPNNIGRH